MILLALAMAAAPATEAERLGVRLARTGMLDAVAALATAKETEEVIRDHPKLTPDQQAKLRAMGKTISDAQRERLALEMGKRYAQALSADELRSLVAFEEGPLAKRYRAAVPAVLAGTMQAVGNIDFKGDLTRSFCSEEAAACEGWKR